MTFRIYVWAVDCILFWWLLTQVGRDQDSFVVAGILLATILPRLCAALLGFRRQACLRLPCDAIWCEFRVCDETGRPYQVLSPWCSHRIRSSILLSQCQALASWLFWLLGTYSIFADYALTGECHPATWWLFSPVRDLYRFSCTGGALCCRSFVQACALQLIPHSTVYRLVYFSEFVYRMAYGVLTTAPTVVRSRLTSAYNNNNNHNNHNHNQIYRHAMVQSWIAADSNNIWCYKKRWKALVSQWKPRLLRDHKDIVEAEGHV